MAVDEDHEACKGYKDWQRSTFRLAARRRSYGNFGILRWVHVDQRTMSANGTKRTFSAGCLTSASGGKADIAQWFH